MRTYKNYINYMLKSASDKVDYGRHEALDKLTKEELGRLRIARQREKALREKILSTDRGQELYNKVDSAWNKLKTFTRDFVGMGPTQATREFQDYLTKEYTKEFERAGLGVKRLASDVDLAARYQDIINKSDAPKELKQNSLHSQITEGLKNYDLKYYVNKAYNEKMNDMIRTWGPLAAGLGLAGLGLYLASRRSAVPAPNPSAINNVPTINTTGIDWADRSKTGVYDV